MQGTDGRSSILTYLQIDDIQYLFNYVDEDKDGLISFDEFKKILIEAEIDIDFDTLFKLIETINPERKRCMTWIWLCIFSRSDLKMNNTSVC